MSQFCTTSGTPGVAQSFTIKLVMGIIKNVPINVCAVVFNPLIVAESFSGSRISLIFIAYISPPNSKNTLKKKQKDARVKSLANSRFHSFSHSMQNFFRKALDVKI